jgi:hypothetical protein
MDLRDKDRTDAGIDPSTPNPPAKNGRSLSSSTQADTENMRGKAGACRIDRKVDYLLTTVLLPTLIMDPIYLRSLLSESHGCAGRKRENAPPVPGGVSVATVWKYLPGNPSVIAICRKQSSSLRALSK